MKRILLSGGIILSVVGVVAGATYAAWTASTNISGNTVGTAQLAIEATAEGKSNPVAAPLPFNQQNMLPGQVTSPELRAVVENKSPVPLDLYMYVQGTGGAACSATKLAWQSSHPGHGVLLGYPATPLPANPGEVSSAGDTNFTLVYSGVSDTNLWGIGNKVLIADSTNFQPGDEIAIRQIVGLATDASNSLQGTACNWTLYFVGEAVTP